MLWHSESQNPESKAQRRLKREKGRVGIFISGDGLLHLLPPSFQLSLGEKRRGMEECLARFCE